MEGFHNLFAPEPFALRQKARGGSRRVDPEDVVLDIDKETRDSRTKTKKVGRILGGSAAQNRSKKGGAKKKSSGPKAANKKTTKRKPARKTTYRGPRHVTKGTKPRKKFAGASVNLFAQLHRLGLLRAVGQKKGTKKKQPTKRKR